MRKFVFLLLMMLPMISFAQRVDKPGEPYDVYCVLKWVFLTEQNEAEIFIGNLVQGKYIADDNGKRIKFKNQADCLTYMSKRGWVLIDHVGDITSSELVMRKSVRNDEEALEHLSFFDFKKKSRD